MFQITGWSIFALLNIYVAYIAKELLTPVVVINLLLASTGLYISHQFRNYILQHQWIKLSTEQLVQKVILALLIVTVIYTLFYYSFTFFLYRESFHSLKIASLFGSIISVFLLFGCWSLIYFAWGNVEKNRNNVIHQLTLESTMKDLEIKTIRSNLQPHFIFNALNSIRALIDENPGQAREAITHISNILRNSITKQEPTDTLANELSLVDDYLALEKIRFEERLHIEKEIGTNTLAYQIPTMMLQTLVENAIKHGIAKSEEGGTIFIQTQIDNTQQLCIQIGNTGKLDISSKDANSLGFGLHATKQRLVYLCGNDASIDMQQKQKQVIVTILIPHPKTLPK